VPGFTDRLNLLSIALPEGPLSTSMSTFVLHSVLACRTVSLFKTSQLLKTHLWGSFQWGPCPTPSTLLLEGEVYKEVYLFENIKHFANIYTSVLVWHFLPWMHFLCMPSPLAKRNKESQGITPSSTLGCNSVSYKSFLSGNFTIKEVHIPKRLQ